MKIGNRFASLQPIAQGLKTMFGSTSANAGRGLALRMDHGTQYTADDFLIQIKFSGIAPFTSMPRSIRCYRFFRSRFSRKEIDYTLRI